MGTPLKPRARPLSANLDASQDTSGHLHQCSRQGINDSTLKIGIILIAKSNEQATEGKSSKILFVWFHKHWNIYLFTIQNPIFGLWSKLRIIWLMSYDTYMYYKSISTFQSTKVQSSTNTMVYHFIYALELLKLSSQKMELASWTNMWKDCERFKKRKHLKRAYTLLKEESKVTILHFHTIRDD